MDMKIKARLAILKEYLTLIGFKDIEIRFYSPALKKGVPFVDVRISDLKSETGKLGPEPCTRITAFHSILGNTMEISHMMEARHLARMTDDEVSSIIENLIEQLRRKITEDLHKQAFNRATVPARDFF